MRPHTLVLFLIMFTLGVNSVFQSVVPQLLHDVSKTNEDLLNKMDEPTMLYMIRNYLKSRINSHRVGKRDSVNVSLVHKELKSLSPEMIAKLVHTFKQHLLTKMVTLDEYKHLQRLIYSYGKREVVTVGWIHKCIRTILGHSNKIN